MKPGRLILAATILVGAVSAPVDAAPPGSRCPQWYRAAMRAGWTPADWPKVDYLLWRESRCVPGLISTTGDYGLLQVNLRHLSTPGYAALCARTSATRVPICTADDLLRPRRGLRAARILSDVALSWFGNRWQPWGLS